MQVQALHLALFLVGGGLSSQADNSASGWIPDRLHPEVQYRLKCVRGGLTIQWRNSYPGAVTLKARVKGSNYDGVDEVVIPPGGSATSRPETMYCSAASFEITEKRFSMELPPSSVPATPEEPKKPAPLPPTVAPWVLPAKVPELPPEALAFIHIGMKREEVLRIIGSPASKLTIPAVNELVETYRYRISSGRAGAVRFSNGIVTGVVVPQP